MSEFKLLRDEKYREMNTSDEVQKLYTNVIKDSSDGPFITSDLSELIINYCFKQNNAPKEIEIKEKVMEAIRFFRKGNEEEVLELVVQKLTK